MWNFKLNFSTSYNRKKPLLVITERAKEAEKRVVDFRREAIKSQFLKHNGNVPNLKAGHIENKRKILTPMNHIDRKMFSMSPDPVLDKRYCSLMSEEVSRNLPTIEKSKSPKKRKIKIKIKNRSRMESSRYKKVYKVDFFKSI